MVYLCFWMSGWLNLRCIAASCVLEDLQQPLKVPPVSSQLYSGHDAKECLNTSVMVVLTMTPSLGPNLCYWLAEDELSTGGKKKIKRFKMVNRTQQWPTEEIYITNCLCTDHCPSICLCFYALRLIQWPHRQVTLYAARIVPHGFKFRVFANTRRDCCCGKSPPLPSPPSLLHI